MEKESGKKVSIFLNLAISVIIVIISILLLFIRDVPPDMRTGIYPIHSYLSTTFEIVWAIQILFNIFFFTFVLAKKIKSLYWMQGSFLIMQFFAVIVPVLFAIRFSVIEEDLSRAGIYFLFVILSSYYLFKK